MNFKSLLKSPKLLTILHEVLEKDMNTSLKTATLLKEEDYTYNQYSLLITMDFVIKYQIIINDEKYNANFLEGLDYIIKSYQNHHDFVIKGNTLLIELISKKFNLDPNTIEDKKKILAYIYEQYIVNGYCFHSFPSVFKKEVEEQGLTKNIDIKEQNDLKRINYIFSHHNYQNIISRDLNAKNKAIYITDSPAMAYYYAIRSPEYLALLTSLSKYYKNIKHYDKNAFYEKDYLKCKSNLASLCKHVNMTVKEENTILKTFDKRWYSLNMSKSTPCIAFIKRKDLAKDTLPNINKIMEEVDKIDLNILISKITDSKYPLIRRYSDINSLDLTVITMPSYKEIKNNKFIEKETSKKPLLKPKTREEYQEEKNIINYKYAYSYGNASVIALTGLLLITLGLTLTIIINVLGGYY